MLGKVLKQRYKVYDQVGSGGFATVYLARDITTNTVVAIKVLHGYLGEEERVVRRFLREAEIARRLQNIHLVQVIDVDLEDEQYFLVMEYVQGRTLGDLIKERGPFSVNEALGLISQALDGLAAIHEAGIIHRDIKPQNMMITPEGILKIMDFGIAKDTSATQGLTATGATMGTPHYIAPEQISGAQIDQRTDIYALGIVLYQMLTGQLPFQGNTSWEIINKRMTYIPPPLSQMRGDVPPFVDKLVLRALARDPAERLPNARAMQSSIDQYLRNNPVTPPGGASREEKVLPTASTSILSEAIVQDTFSQRQSQSGGVTSTPLPPVVTRIETPLEPPVYLPPSAEYQQPQYAPTPMVNQQNWQEEAIGYQPLTMTQPLISPPRQEKNSLLGILIGSGSGILIFGLILAGLIFLPFSPLTRTNSVANVATTTTTTTTTPTTAVTLTPTANAIVVVITTETPTPTSKPIVGTVTSVAVLTPQGKYIEVSLVNQTVILHNGDNIDNTFPCSTGVGNALNDPNTTTFPGTTTITLKEATHKTAVGLRYYWLTFDQKNQNGFFAEATDNEELFGKPSTRGGVLLHQKDAKILFDWADPGTTVVVQ